MYYEELTALHSRYHSGHFEENEVNSNNKYLQKKLYVKWKFG